MQPQHTQNDKTDCCKQALTWLLTVPGASRTVLESRVPYAQSALQDVLGQSTSSYASVGTAHSMAKAAYQQAAQLTQFGSSIVGVGCTCALMTDRVKKGDHKASMMTFVSGVIACKCGLSQVSLTLHSRACQVLVCNNDARDAMAQRSGHIA